MSETKRQRTSRPPKKQWLLKDWLAKEAERKRFRSQDHSDAAITDRLIDQLVRRQ